MELQTKIQFHTKDEMKDAWENLSDYKKFSSGKAFKTRHPPKKRKAMTKKITHEDFENNPTLILHDVNGNPDPVGIPDEVLKKQTAHARAIYFKTMKPFWKSIHVSDDYETRLKDLGLLMNPKVHPFAYGILEKEQEKKRKRRNTGLPLYREWTSDGEFLMVSFVHNDVSRQLYKFDKHQHHGYFFSTRFEYPSNPLSDTLNKWKNLQTQ